MQPHLCIKNNSSGMHIAHHAREIFDKRRRNNTTLKMDLKIIRALYIQHYLSNLAFFRRIHVDIQHAADGFLV